MTVRYPGGRQSTYLPPVVIQIIGAVLLVAFGSYWFITGKQSSLLVGASLTLVFLGRYGAAGDELRRRLGPPPSTDLRENEEAPDA